MVLAALWWFCVRTKVLGRDRGVSVGGEEAGRDIDLRSRPGLLKLGVATWIFEVVTWGRLLGRVATSARPASVRPALAVPATCTRPACCARSSAHDLGTARVVCTGREF